MKIGEAKQICYANHTKLFDRMRSLSKRKEEADAQYRITGKDSFSKEAATLELSLNDTKKAYEENQKVIEEVMDQWTATFNAGVSEQQGEAMAKYAEDLGKIMTVFRRLAHGDIVPQGDERRLMEYDEKMYQAAKNLQMMAQMAEKERKRHKSLWDDDEAKETPADPMETADNNEYAGEVSDIAVPEAEAAADGLVE